MFYELKFFLQIFVMTRNIYWKQWKVRPILESECFFECRFPRSDTLEWLKLELEKELGFRNLQEKLKNDILLPKLFWPTVRENCSNDWRKLLKFEAVGWEFENFLRSLEPENNLFQQWKVGTIFGNRMLF